MCEVEKCLEVAIFNSGQSTGEEMLIVQREYCSGLQVLTIEGNIRKNESKGKRMMNDLNNF